MPTVTVIFKTCCTCKQVKDACEFRPHKRSKDGLNWACKTCGAEANAKWRSQNKEQAKSAVRRHYANNKEAYATRQRLKLSDETNRSKHRSRMLMKAYGITVEDYDRMFDACGGKCQICGKPPGVEGKRVNNLVVDHCHETGRIRGLLCSLCNRALGQLGDTAESLMRAVEYLRTSSDLVGDGVPRFQPAEASCDVS